MSTEDEWIKKLWPIYLMEYYSALKKYTFESVLMRWMNLEPIIQGKVSQKEKHIYTESRRMVLKNLFTGEQWRNRHREHTNGHGVGAGGRRWYVWRE